MKNLEIPKPPKYFLAPAPEAFLEGFTGSTSNIFIILLIKPKNYNKCDKFNATLNIRLTRKLPSLAFFLTTSLVYARGTFAHTSVIKFSLRLNEGIPPVVLKVHRSSL